MSDIVLCDGCRKNDAQGKLECSQCHSAFYCSESCLNFHANLHQGICEAMIFLIGPKAQKVEGGSSPAMNKPPQTDPNVIIKLKPNQPLRDNEPGKKRQLEEIDEETSSGEEMETDEVPSIQQETEYTMDQRFRIASDIRQTIENANASAQKELLETKNIMNQFIDRVNELKIMIRRLPLPSDDVSESGRLLLQQTNDVMALMYPQMDTDIPLFIDKLTIVNLLHEIEHAWSEFYRGQQLNDATIIFNAYQAISQSQSALIATLSGQDVNFVLHSKFAKEKRSDIDTIANYIAAPILDQFKKALSSEEIHKAYKNIEYRNDCISNWQYIEFLQQVVEQNDSMDTSTPIGNGMTDSAKAFVAEKWNSFIAFFDQWGSQLEQQAVQNVVRAHKKIPNPNGEDESSEEHLTPEQEKELQEENEKLQKKSERTKQFTQENQKVPLNNNRARRQSSKSQSSNTQPEPIQIVSHTQNQEIVIKVTKITWEKIFTHILSGWNLETIIREYQKRNDDTQPSTFTQFILGYIIDTTQILAASCIYGALSTYLIPVLVHLGREPKTAAMSLNKLTNHANQNKSPAHDQITKLTEAQENEVVDILNGRQGESLSIDQNDFHGMCYPGDRQGLQHERKVAGLTVKFAEAANKIYDTKKATLINDALQQAKANIPYRDPNVPSPNAITSLSGDQNIQISTNASHYTSRLMQHGITALHKTLTSTPANIKVNSLQEEQSLPAPLYNQLWEHRGRELINFQKNNEEFVDAYCYQTMKLPNGETTLNPNAKNQCLLDLHDAILKPLMNDPNAMGERARILYKDEHKTMNAAETERLAHLAQVRTALNEALPSNLPMTALERADVRRILIEAGTSPEYAEAFSNQDTSLHGLISRTINEGDFNLAETLSRESMQTLRHKFSHIYPSQKEQVTQEANREFRENQQKNLMDNLIKPGGLLAYNFALQYCIAQGAASITALTSSPFVIIAITGLTTVSLGLAWQRNSTERKLKIAKASSASAHSLPDIQKQSLEKELQGITRKEDIIRYTKMGFAAYGAYYSVMPSIQNWWQGNCSSLHIDIGGYEMASNLLDSFVTTPLYFLWETLITPAFTNVHTVLWLAPQAIGCGSLTIFYTITRSILNLSLDTAGGIIETLSTDSILPVIPIYAASLPFIAVYAASYYLFSDKIRTVYENLQKEFDTWPARKGFTTLKVGWFMYKMAIDLWPMVMLTNGFSTLALQYTIQNSTSIDMKNNFKALDNQLKGSLWDRLSIQQDRSWRDALLNPFNLPRGVQPRPITSLEMAVLRDNERRESEILAYNRNYNIATNTSITSFNAFGQKTNQLIYKDFDQLNVKIPQENQAQFIKIMTGAGVPEVRCQAHLCSIQINQKQFPELAAYNDMLSQGKLKM